MKAAAWITLAVIGSFLLVEYMDSPAPEPIKTPEQIAADRARGCMESAQRRLLERGYRAPSDIQVGAAMACQDEIDALKRYDKR
jgi:hypothetical protein